MSNVLKFGSGWHSSVPNEFIQNPQYPPLHNGAFRLFVVLISYASPTSPQPFPTWETLAANTGCCRNSLAKWLRELAHRGWIRREQLAGDNGRFGHNVYTLFPEDEDSIQKRKQFSAPPSTILRDTVARYPVARYTVKCDTKSTNILKSTKKKNTNTKRSADADGVGGVKLPASRGEGREKDDPGEGEVSGAVLLATKFMERWCWGYEKWFGVPYVVKEAHQKQATEVLQRLTCKAKELAAYAFRMWINTSQVDEVMQRGFDPLFYQVKASRNLTFFLRYIDNIAEEQKHPLDADLKELLPSEYNTLETAISAGRPAPA